MTTITGQIKKLASKFDTPIEYSFPIGDDLLPLNKMLGQTLSLSFLNEICCIQCNRKTTKSFQQGYCYPCYRKLLDCNLCVIHPEKCNYPQAECPDTWEHEQCKQEHVVYLANSSGLKVGITRFHNTITRWIDQGASQAITLFKVGNRNLSGHIEVLFKKHVADKTNWRKMLSGNPETLDMMAVKESLLNKVEKELNDHYGPVIQRLDDPCITLSYPILEFPKKLNTLNLDKDSVVSGQLLGLKGQYLILDTGVINIRKFSGYQVAVTF